MISVGIVDDEQIWINKIKEVINTHFKDIQISTYQSVQDIDDNLDFLLLDVDMPDADGIEFSKKNRDSKIIFVTNYDTRIKAAFGSNVYGYVSKNNLEAELIQKVAEILKVIKDDHVVRLNVNGMNVNIRISDIIYCQYLGNHVVSIIVCNSVPVNINNTSLKKIQGLLDERFIETNRDMLINKHKIIDFDDKYVYLDGVNSNFEVSVRKRKLVKQCFYEVFE